MHVISCDKLLYANLDKNYEVKRQIDKDCKIIQQLEVDRTTESDVLSIKYGEISDNTNYPLGNKSKYYR